MGELGTSGGDETIVEHMGVSLDVGDKLFTPVLIEALQQGWFETPEAEALKVLVEPDDVFLEIGAGCGFISSFVAKLQRASQIIAIEANPELIPIIKSTHARNGVEAVLLNELIGREDKGLGKLYVDDNFLASSTMVETNESVSVPCTSFQHRLDEYRPSIVCIDIEGAEIDILANAIPPFLERIVVELHEFAYGLKGVDKIFRSMSDQGMAYVSTASRGPVVGFRRF